MTSTTNTTTTLTDDQIRDLDEMRLVLAGERGVDFYALESALETFTAMHDAGMDVEDAWEELMRIWNATLKAVETGEAFRHPDHDEIEALDAQAQAEEREHLADVARDAEKHERIALWSVPGSEFDFGVRDVLYRGKKLGAVTDHGDGWYASTEMWLDDDVLVGESFESARAAANALFDALAAVHDLDDDTDEAMEAASLAVDSADREHEATFEAQKAALRSVGSSADAATKRLDELVATLSSLRAAVGHRREHAIDLLWGRDAQGASEVASNAVERIASLMQEAAAACEAFSANT